MHSRRPRHVNCPCAGCAARGAPRKPLANFERSEGPPLTTVLKWGSRLFWRLILIGGWGGTLATLELRERFARARVIEAERILFSDNGIPTEPFVRVQRTSSDTLRLGFVGTIAEWKGVDWAPWAQPGQDDAWALFAPWPSLAPVFGIIFGS